MVREAIRMSVPDGDWVLLSAVIKNIRQKIDPTFDPHDHCYTQSKTLVESGQDEFETDDGENIGKPLGYYVRLKPTRQNNS